MKSFLLNLNNIDLEKQYTIKIEVTRLDLKTFFLNLFGKKNPTIQTRVSGKDYLRIINDIHNSVCHGGKSQ